VYNNEYVAALDSTVVGYISRSDFESAIGGIAKTLAVENEALTALKRIRLFSSLSVQKFRAIALAL
jgi:hypothetical protein